MSTTRYTSLQDISDASFFSTNVSLPIHSGLVKQVLETAKIRFPKEDWILEPIETFIGCFLSNVQASTDYSGKLAFSSDHAFTKLEQYNTPAWKKLTHHKRHGIMGALQTLGYVKLYSRGQNVAKADRPCLSLWKAGPNLHTAFDKAAIAEERLKDYKPSIIRDAREIETEVTSEETETINQYNRHWMPRVNFIAKPMYMVFNHDENLNGRVYGSFQNMKQVERKNVMIDGEETAEVDFSASHMNIASLWITGETVEDAYTNILKNVSDKTITRDDIKMAIMRFMNSSNPSAGLQWIEKWSKLKTHEVIGAIEKTFPFMAKIKGKQFGLVAMRIEGLIATRMFQWAMENNEVILPVHDSFVCRSAISGQVEEMMNRVREDVIREFDFDAAMESLKAYKAAKKAAQKAEQIVISEEERFELMEQVEKTATMLKARFNSAIIEAHIEPKITRGLTPKDYALGQIPLVVGRAVENLKAIWKDQGVTDDPWEALLEDDLKRIEKGRYPKWFA